MLEQGIEGAKETQGAFVLAMVRSKLGEKDEARRWYDKGIQWMDKDKPKDKELLLFRDEAGKLLRLADLLQSAGLHAQQRQWDKAIADYTEAIRLDPKSATAYIHRARAHEGKGDSDKAQADYNESLRIDPNSARWLGYSLGDDPEPLMDEVHSYTNVVWLYGGWLRHGEAPIRAARARRLKVILCVCTREEMDTFRKTGIDLARRNRDVVCAVASVCPIRIKLRQTDLLGSQRRLRAA